MSFIKLLRNPLKNKLEGVIGKQSSDTKNNSVKQIKVVKKFSSISEKYVIKGNGVTSTYAVWRMGKKGHEYDSKIAASSTAAAIKNGIKAGDKEIKESLLVGRNILQSLLTKIYITDIEEKRSDYSKDIRSAHEKEFLKDKVTSLKYVTNLNVKGDNSKGTKIVTIPDLKFSGWVHQGENKGIDYSEGYTQFNKLAEFLYNLYGKNNFNAAENTEILKIIEENIKDIFVYSYDSKDKTQGKEKLGISYYAVDIEKIKKGIAKLENLQKKNIQAEELRKNKENIKPNNWEKIIFPNIDTINLTVRQFKDEIETTLTVEPQAEYANRNNHPAPKNPKQEKISAVALESQSSESYIVTPKPTDQGTFVTSNGEPVNLYSGRVTAETQETMIAPTDQVSLYSGKIDVASKGIDKDKSNDWMKIIFPNTCTVNLTVRQFKAEDNLEIKTRRAAPIRPVKELAKDNSANIIPTPLITSKEEELIKEVKDRAELIKTQSLEGTTKIVFFDEISAFEVAASELSKEKSGRPVKASAPENNSVSDIIKIFEDKNKTEPKSWSNKVTDKEKPNVSTGNVSDKIKLFENLAKQNDNQGKGR